MSVQSGVPGTGPAVHDRVMVRIDRQRSVRVNRAATARVALVVAALAATVQRVPGAVLRPVPTSVRIVLFDDRRFLLDDLWEG